MNTWRIFGILALALAFWAPLSQAHTRISWERGEPRITNRMAPRDGVGALPIAARVAALHGKLTTLARADASLYAVFLDSEASFGELTRVLRDVGGPSIWPRARQEDTGLATFLDQRATYEWLELGSNGSLTIYADEARQPGKQFVVVVNGAGEVVGFRPLWASTDDLANLR